MFRNYDPPTMALIGMAKIVDCVERHSSRCFFDMYGFVLRDAVRFKKPIPCKGQLGIFQVPVRLVRGTRAAKANPGCLVDHA